ncbi:MAG: bifunctional oligoribonuclease/PAP phosphatase NrnA [Candidatus Omnitrophica bacterium]|nr:bifunctional oligoribonuclease/PAP phosphatase NrnA [Candidatus Omnitrophota bacterium]MBL7210517.1 bifunctional oligoribonuclease/PAP phosphatase NrnA [Candidatus Omnitrophota bacterium]
MSLNRSADCIKRNKIFLLTTHTSPEGDALGSQLAFYRLLEKLGKQAMMINEDPCPSGYEFLPGVQKIKKFSRKAEDIRFDCLVTLDCADLKRTGEVHRLNTQAKPVLNIDHHISNQGFGDINWIEPSASSCAEMVYLLYKKLKIPLDKESAICLYAGILTDTGSFHYSNTSALTHKIVSHLLGFGLDIPRIYKYIYENVPYQEMKLLADILPGMRSCAQGRIIWFQIKHNLLRGRRLAFDLSENILNFGRAVKGVDVVALFKENLGVKDEIRVSLRSHGRVDVNKIASFFGGGGHKNASGTTIRGKIDPVRNRVLRKIKEAL